MVLLENLKADSLIMIVYVNKINEIQLTCMFHWPF